MSGSKLRPAVVRIETAKEFVACFISQIQWQEPPDIYLQPDVSNDLKWPSLIGTSKTATIQKLISVGKMRSLNQNLKKLLQLSESLALHFHYRNP